MKTCGTKVQVKESFRSVIPVVYLRTKWTNTCRKAVKNTTIVVIYRVC